MGVSFSIVLSNLSIKLTIKCQFRQLKEVSVSSLNKKQLPKLSHYWENNCVKILSRLNYETFNERRL